MDTEHQSITFIEIYGIVLHANERVENQQLSRRRVFIERIISGVKRCAILKTISTCEPITSVTL